MTPQRRVDEETHPGHQLSLGKFDLALVGGIWGAEEADT